MYKHVGLFLLAIICSAIVASFVRHEPAAEKATRPPMVLNVKKIKIGKLTLGATSRQVLEVKGEPSEKIPTGSLDIEVWDFSDDSSLILEKDQVTQYIGSRTEPLMLPKATLKTGIITPREFRNITGFSEDQLSDDVNPLRNTSINIQGGQLIVAVNADAISYYGVQLSP